VHHAGVREILPGLFHWTAVHPKIKIEVSSYYVVEPGVLIDPLVPAGGLGWFRARRAPEFVILTNRHHFRHCAEYQREFRCTVWCNAEGMQEFQAGEKVEPFEVGHVFPGEIESHAVGALCPDETALRIPIAEGVLAVADGVVRNGRGPLSFVPDFLIADTPEEVERVKRELRSAYTRLLDLEWNHLLCAHGHPWIDGAKQALRAFVGG
jgi:hypothetical protein